jgi:hypothetical protein
MELSNIQDKDYQFIVNYFHQYIDSKLFKSKKITKILHMIITFCTIFPFRESDNLQFNAVIDKLQCEKRALFQLCLYNFAQSRVVQNSKTTISEFGQSTTCFHMVGELIKNIFTNQKIINDCYVVICNCYDSVFLDNSQFYNFVDYLHDFITFPTDVVTFKYYYYKYAK